MFVDSVGALHIFSVGVSLGLLSTILSNRKEIDNLNTKEIDNLNTMLKSSENLVQDLQEELEKKDTLTVKELAKEVTGHQKPSDMVLSLEPVVKYDNDQVFLPTEESRSEIEAELEIELEKLEMGMNSSVFSAKKSVLDEVRPMFFASLTVYIGNQKFILNLQLVMVICILFNSFHHNQ